MLETVVALTLGTRLMLALLGAFALVGLYALARTRAPLMAPEEGVRYVFGLGKNPKLRHVPGNRDVPATPEPLGGEGLKSLAADADAASSYDVARYRMRDGRTAPYELSGDIPDDIRAIELTRGEARVIVDDDGQITASRRLDEEELEDLETLFTDLWEEEPPRADRRTWSPPEHDPEDANVHRV